jgi:hypothetical protein
MKVIKYISILVLTTVLFCLTATGASAQDKVSQKQSKKAAAQFVKDGWQVFGNVSSVKDGMDAHYKALSEGKGMLMTIEGHGIAKDLNMAVRKSQYNAASQYAAMQESKVEGVTEMTTNSKSDGEEASSNVEISSHFQSTTEQTVKSLKPSVVFFREMSDGRYEVRAFYIAKTLE